MKKLLLTIIAVCTFSITQAQNIEELKTWDGEYHLMDGERSLIPKQTVTKHKTIQISKLGTTTMLAMSEHVRITPSLFTYVKTSSDKIGKPVFFNRVGLYFIAIDNNSFVSFGVTSMLGKQVWESVTFSNYYSKDPAKVKLMTKEKLLEMAKEISKKAL